MSNLRIAPITKKKKEQEKLRITPILTEEEKKQQIMSQSKVMAPVPQVTMTQNNINNIAIKNIVSGGLQNDIHNLNMSQATKINNTKIDLSSKDKSGGTTPFDLSEFIYNDTGKKYGDYYYDNYELYKDMPIYEQKGKYYLKTNRGYEPIGRLDKNGNVVENLMTNEEAERKDLEKAQKLGYKDNLTKITTQDYDDAQETFKKLQKEYKLSDKELNDWLKTGDLDLSHISLQTNSMSNLRNKAEDYREKINSGKIKQYDQQGFGIENQIYLDTQNLSDIEKQQYISYITGKKDKTQKNNNTFFKGSSVFDDGYQFGDVTKATLGTVGNAGISLAKGVGKFVEGTGDFATNLVGSGLELMASDKDKKDVKEFHNNTWNIGYKYGNKNYWYDDKNDILYDENWNRVYNFDINKMQKRYTYANGVAEFGRQMKEQTVNDDTSEVFDEILHGNDLRKMSVLGNKSEGMLESLGQAIPLMAAGGSVGGLYGESAAVATTSGLTFSSTYGNAKTEAIRNGATEKEAMETAFIQASAETISEQFFDAIPGAKSAGWGEKLVGKVGNGVEKYLGSKTAKIVTKTLDISGEGFEEIISNMLTAGGNDIVHYFDKDYNYGMENQTGNILEDMKNAMTSQDSMDSFVSAIITSAILNGGSAKVNSSQKKAIIQAYANEYNMSFNEAKSRLKIDGDKIEFDTRNINQTQNTSNLPNNLAVEQRNINNNINNQVSDNVQNSMATMQNNNISENINNQQNNQLKNLIEPQKINYSKNVNDRIDLEDYDFKTEQVIKSAERNVIVRNYRQLDTLIDEALDTQSNKALHFGRINETITQRIKRKLENLPKMKAPYLTKEKYDLVMNQSEIRHLIDEKTMMTREDVHKYVGVLPEIISNFDSASYSIEPDSEGIRFKKKLPDGNYISFVLVSNKQSTLKAKSIHLDKIDYETKKRSISPTNDVLKTPDRTSETDGAFASMKADGVESGDIMSSDINVQDDTSVAFLDNNNTTTSPKSQIAPLPQYNMQQNTKNDTTKVKPPIAKEYQKNTIDEKKSNHEDVIKVQAEEIANQLNSGKPLNTKERRWIETSTESDILKGKIFKDDLDVHKINYEVQSNKKSLKEANNKLDMLGYDGSIKNIKNLIDDGRVPTASDMALAQRTLQEAAKRGDTEIAQNLIMDVAILGTELGQATQALSMINKLTPEGQLKLYSKIVHRAKLMGDKSFQDVEITPEMVEMILNAYDKNGNYDQNDLNNRVEQFKQKVADQLKTSVEEKIDAWRYLSMLGNPKTHIRNIISNVAMKCTIAYKNALARTIETFAPINTRTKTWKKASPEIKQYAKNTAIEMKNIITGESKYGEKASLESKKRIFKLAPLEAISNFNSNALEVEDWFFSKRAFINTFQEYLTANGINTMEDIQNNPDIVEKGKTYAVEQAEIATFRQYSKLASAINKIERNNKVAKYVIKATVPFKKTPINVAKAGVKYSPLGLIKNVTYDIYQVKKGNINASQFIDNLSQGLSGTTLTILGYALAKAGILTGANGDDKDDKYDSYLGKQGYSIKIGNKYYSLSWLSPTAMPMFVGANIYEQFEDKKGWDMNVLSESLAKTLDPLNEMSFVSSLTDALNSYESGNDKIKGMGESVIQSYIGQFFPTLFSQFASVGDDTKRSTKASSDSSYKFGEQTVRSIMYKIPGLRNKLEPSTDIWGNEIKQNENILMRALESFILPYSAKEYKNSSIDKEIKKVYNNVGNTDVIPGFPQSYVKYDKVQYRMSAKEYTKYKKTYGTSANTMLNMLMNTSNYKNSTGKRKTRMIKKVYDYSREISKEEFLSNRNIDYDKKKFKYNKNDYEKIVNYITSSTQYKDDD